MNDNRLTDSNTPTLPIPEETVQRVREVSRALLGSGSRLEVGAYLADRVGRSTYVRDVSRALGFNDPDVKRDFEKLIAAGLMENHGRAARNQPLFYEPLPSVYWDFVKALRGGSRVATVEAGDGI
jgi:hypothetical protein